MGFLRKLRNIELKEIRWIKYHTIVVAAYLLLHDKLWYFLNAYYVEVVGSAEFLY